MGEIMEFNNLSKKFFMSILFVAVSLCGSSSLLHAGDTPGSEKNQNDSIYIHSLQIEHLLKGSFEKKGLLSSYFAQSFDIAAQWQDIFKPFNDLLSGYQLSNPSIWKKRFVDFDHLSYGQDSVIETVYRKLNELAVNIKDELKAHRDKIIEYCGLGKLSGKGVRIYSAAMWHQTDDGKPGSSKDSEFIKCLDTRGAAHAISLKDQDVIFNVISYMIAMQYGKQYFIDRCLYRSKSFTKKPAFIIKIESVDDEKLIKPYNHHASKSIQYMDIENSYSVKLLMALYNKIKNFTIEEAKEEDKKRRRWPKLKFIPKTYHNDEDCPHSPIGYIFGQACYCTPEKVRADRLAEKQAHKRWQKELDRLAKTYGEHACEFNHAEVPLFDPVFLGCEYGLFSTGHICDRHKHKKPKKKPSNTVSQLQRIGVKNSVRIGNTNTVQNSEQLSTLLDLADQSADVTNITDATTQGDFSSSLVPHVEKVNTLKLITKELPKLVFRHKKLVLLVMVAVIVAYLGCTSNESVQAATQALLKMPAILFSKISNGLANAIAAAPIATQAMAGNQQESNREDHDQIVEILNTEAQCSIDDSPARVSSPIVASFNPETQSRVESFDPTIMPDMPEVQIDEIGLGEVVADEAGPSCWVQMNPDAKKYEAHGDCVESDFDNVKPLPIKDYDGNVTGELDSIALITPGKGSMVQILGKGAKHKWNERPTKIQISTDLAEDIGVLFDAAEIQKPPVVVQVNEIEAVRAPLNADLSVSESEQAEDSTGFFEKICAKEREKTPVVQDLCDEVEWCDEHRVKCGLKYIQASWRLYGMLNGVSTGIQKDGFEQFAFDGLTSKVFLIKFE
jgi:hypothetical protein